MNVFGKINDSPQMLNDTSIPLNSFSNWGIFGQKATGKTTKQNQIVKEYISRNKKYKYDIDNPYLIQDAPITHVFYLSPTIGKDLTTMVDKDLKNKILIDLSEDNAMENFLEQLNNIVEDINQCLKFQCYIRNYLKSKDCQQLIKEASKLDLKRDLTCQLLRETLNYIEFIKTKYPELNVQEENTTVMKNGQEIYRLLGLKYNNKWIRRQSFIVQIDDSSGQKFMSGSTVNNNFYKFLCQSRHYGCYSVLINVHSITLLFGQFRELLTNIIICQGIKEEHIKDLFGQIGVQNHKYGKDDFKETYLKQIGYYSDDSSKFRYQFIYIMLNPEKRIYENFDKRVL